MKKSKKVSGEVVKQKNKLAVRPVMTLSGQAQQFYDRVQDLKDEKGRVAEKRQNALLVQLKNLRLCKQGYYQKNYSMKQQTICLTAAKKRI